MKLYFCVIAISILPLSAQTTPPQPYVPLTAEQRVTWFVQKTYGPKSLFITGPISAGFRTYRNRPVEWGPHWEGFGKRYGARLLNNSVTNSIEGALGAAWDEDPRYFRIGQGPATTRLRHIVKSTFLSRYSDGRYRFGAAKAIGITGGSFAQKIWMPDSVTTNRDCMVRIGTGYGGRLLGNFFREFVPDLKKAVRFGH